MHFSAAHRTHPPTRSQARGRRAAALLHVWLVLSVWAVAWVAAALDADRMGRAAQKLGPQAVSEARALQSALAELASADERARLAGVNSFYNRRMGFRDDQLVWGRLDYWASPLEFMQQGQGDCEDFAMAKYFSLLGLGVPSERMRLVYVRAAIGGPGGASQAHMVLAYYPAPQAEPLILDNLIGDIRPASRRPDLTPVFSFNTEGLWQGVGAASAGDPLARLSRWREVLAKAREEGFLP
jgi:predicted transglutaminase-like cysteine proteinase